MSDPRLLVDKMLGCSALDWPRRVPPITKALLESGWQRVVVDILPHRDGFVVMGYFKPGASEAQATESVKMVFAAQGMTVSAVEGWRRAGAGSPFQVDILGHFTVPAAIVEAEEDDIDLADIVNPALREVPGLETRLFVQKVYRALKAAFPSLVHVVGKASRRCEDDETLPAPRNPHQTPWPLLALTFVFKARVIDGEREVWLRDQVHKLVRDALASVGAEVFNLSAEDDLYGTGTFMAFAEVSAPEDLMNMLDRRFVVNQ